MIGSLLSGFATQALPSAHAEDVRLMLASAFDVAFVSFAVFLALALILVRIYRRQDSDQLGAASRGAQPIALTFWTLGALACGVAAIVSGMPALLGGTVPPADATRTIATLDRDGWTFDHAVGFADDTLHVAVGRPEVLVLKADGSEYDIYIPELGVAGTAARDRDVTTWFVATEPGTYPLHSDHLLADEPTRNASAVVAMAPAVYEAWALTVDDIFTGRTMAEAGRILYDRNGCAVCHSVDGATLVGPTFLDMYGSEFGTTDGGTIVADDAYIRESIVDPAASIIAGFQPIMTPYGDKIDDRGLEAIIAWLRTLSAQGSGNHDMPNARDE